MTVVFVVSASPDEFGTTLGPASALKAVWNSTKLIEASRLPIAECFELARQVHHHVELTKRPSLAEHHKEALTVEGHIIGWMP